MLGIVYALGWLFGSIKQSIRDMSNTIYGRSHLKINDKLYLSGDRLVDMSTEHQVGLMGDYKYKDYKTGTYHRLPLTTDEILQEQLNKENAIYNKRSVFRISSCRLPANVTGTAYQDIDSDRIYVYRYIQTKLSSGLKPLSITSFLISLNEDNYGQVERFINGDVLNDEYVKIFNTRVFSIDKEFADNTLFKWKTR